MTNYYEQLVQRPRDRGRRGAGDRRVAAARRDCGDDLEDGAVTMTLHWWSVPLMLFVCGAVLMLFVRGEGGYFNFPSWHLSAALLFWFAAIAVAIGGFIS